MKAIMIFPILAMLVALTHGYYTPAHYKFAYGVEDDHTGDHHEQHEVRDGQHVRGAYSLKEADGTIRVVEYVAGPHSGFNAVVKRIGHAQHPQHYKRYTGEGGWEGQGNWNGQDGWEGQGWGGQGRWQRQGGWGGQGSWGRQGSWEGQGSWRRQDDNWGGEAESRVGTTHWGYN